MECEDCGAELELESLCIACGLCAAYCTCLPPRQALPLADLVDHDLSDMEDERYFWERY